MPPQPIVFELTSEATGVTILKDSSPQATAADGKVTVVGPFAPGVTNVQFAYAVPYSTGSLTVEQTLPIPLGRVIVLAQKVADMRVASAQMSEQREMPADGQTYVVGQGPGLRAGERLAIAFSNLPHEACGPATRPSASRSPSSPWAGGAARARPVGPVRKSSGQDRLEKRRAQLFAELTTLEEQHRAGRVDPQRYAVRRGELVAALERVYAEIDRLAA